MSILIKKILIIIISFAIIAASFVGGIFVGLNKKPTIESITSVIRKTPEISTLGQVQAGTDFNLFWDVWSRLEENFVDRSKMEQLTAW